MCACISCFKAYFYRTKAGVNTGTSTLSRHLKSCSNPYPGGQQKITGHFPKKTVKASKAQEERLRDKLVFYVSDGNHSYNSVEDDCFLDLLQECVNLGAALGNFDIRHLVPGRNTVKEDMAKLAIKAKEKLNAELDGPREVKLYVNIVFIANIKYFMSD